jgi:D-alanyl-D-alanine carboxypeptidase
MIQLENKLKKIINKANKKFPFLQVYIESNQLKQPIIHSLHGVNQHFHSASVGKLATSSAILRLIQEGKLAFDSHIEPILDRKILNKLFVFDGIDYRSEVTVSHLLGHTSGVNDYFDGITNDKKSILDKVINEPNHFFTPEEMIEFTANNQKPVGKPGDKFLYSDTGYILLALIIEKTTSKPFNQILREKVFKPLEMNDTGLMFYDPIANQEKLAPVIVKKQDIRLSRSLSVDFSGGGLCTTLEDLSKLIRGFQNRDFITQETYLKISNFSHHFTSGMFYGLGLMELRFEKMFFLLKGLPKLQGHLGVLGVHAWINPFNRDIFVINISNMSQMVSSFNLLISLVTEFSNFYKKNNK